MRRLFIATALLLSLPSPGSAQDWGGCPVVIRGDAGGQIGPYIERLLVVRESRCHVIIDGPCLSPCTMVLGIVPSNRVCATPRARFGFHAAWNHGENGRPVINKGGTRLLRDIYPSNVNGWIKRKGGLTREFKFANARQLGVRACR